ncbi:hypothetical protein OESDEN_24769 [Oesophagostomum dentatum]|uniref:DUF7622 domain-containing protein n=1 Tax=Oesophagostomum dentatum TaxID=61180 RepID=A0A0B1RX28_OESDE|nr:hypothetical protein OESDEN_24769 [Oesophagostomum dentatum]
MLWIDGRRQGGHFPNGKSRGMPRRLSLTKSTVCPLTKLCKGQYCIISATPQGDVYRGCMTLDQSKNEGQAIAPGYYQSYNGIEQWVCATSSCNYDLQKMEESWPEEMAQYKNITTLSIRGLFEELNAATNISGTLLFVIIALIARLLML